jgi:hypothetical protein
VHKLGGALDVATVVATLLVAIELVEAMVVVGATEVVLVATDVVSGTLVPTVVVEMIVVALVLGVVVPVVVPVVEPLVVVMLVPRAGTSEIRVQRVTCRVGSGLLVSIPPSRFAQWTVTEIVLYPKFGSFVTTQER